MLVSSISGPGIGTPVDLNSCGNASGYQSVFYHRLKNVVCSNSTKVFKSWPYLIALPLLLHLIGDTCISLCIIILGTASKTSRHAWAGLLKSAIIIWNEIAGITWMAT